MAKPWEKYQEAEVAKSKAVKVADKGPWDSYVANHAEQEELERTMPDTVADMALLTANGASHDLLDEGYGAMTKMTGGDYTEGRDRAREAIGESRDNLGFAGDALETAGNVAISHLVPGGPVVKELASAAIQGLGSAPEMEDAPKHVAISTGISAAGQLGGKFIRKVTDLDMPNRILARTAGARGQDFMKGGIEGLMNKEGKRAPELVAKRLDNLGFFRQGDVGWSREAGKFVPAHPQGSSRLDRFFQPQSIDDLHNRAMETVAALKGHNQELLKGKTVPMDKLAATLKEAVEDYVPDGYGYSDRLKAAQKIVGTILDDLHMQGKIKRSSMPSELMKPVIPGTKVSGNNMHIDANDVEGIKRQLYAEVEATFKQGKAADKLDLGPEAQRKFSAKIDKLMDSYGGEQYAKNNDHMHDLLQISEDIYNKTTREAGYGVQGPRLTMGSQVINGVKDALVNNTPAGVGQARLGQGMATKTGQMVREGMTKLPVEMYNNRSGRSPQSVPNIPEDLIRTPLPRTTEEMIKNKNFVLAKIAQMAPDMFEAVKDTYEHEPEMLSQLAPVIAQKLPHFFARDKYNRFDNRIITEQDKQRAIKDTLSDQKLNSIQQAEIITKLNRDGIYEGI